MDEALSTAAARPPAVNRPGQILFASLVGTAIEYFDFYIYANATVLVFPRLFFPNSDPTTATLSSFATFALAFVARPVGSAIFGHFGDRVGRKTTLVAALVTMGVSTIAIGLLPTYQTIGLAAPILLSLCRLGQGLGLGGEWGGAVLLAVENAPPDKRAWYGMFPQLGAPIGFLFAGGGFLAMSKLLTNEQFFSFGWRIPFLASAVLVLVGLYVRLTITETAVFAASRAAREPVKVPLAKVLSDHWREVVFGCLIALSTFVLFYLMQVFVLTWGTTKLGYSRDQFLVIQLVGALLFAATVPLSAVLAQNARRPTLMVVNIVIALFGLAMAPLLEAGTAGAVAAVVGGMGLVGWLFGPLGTVLSELFPTSVRYSGASLTFNLAGILGASLSPYIALWLAQTYGLHYVGLYLSTSGLLSLVGLLATRETGGTDL